MNPKFLEVVLRYRCKGCGKEWEDKEKVEWRAEPILVGWAGNHVRCGMHRCEERVAGQIEFLGARW